MIVNICTARGTSNQFLTLINNVLNHKSLVPGFEVLEKTKIFRSGRNSFLIFYFKLSFKSLNFYFYFIFIKFYIFY